MKENEAEKMQLRRECKVDADPSEKEDFKQLRRKFEKMKDDLP